MAVNVGKVWSAAVVAGAVLLGAACSTENTAAEAVAGDGNFPVVVEHEFGETTIPSAPERVALVGPTDSDTVLALGVTPLVVSQWIPDWDAGVAPWSENALGDTDPGIMAYPEINFEKIAASDPDVIIASAMQIDRAQYDMLSGIAPTIAHTRGYRDAYTVPWDVQTLHVGTALGEQERAQALVDDMNSTLEEIRATHPQWSGLTAATLFNRDSGFGIYASDDNRGQFMNDLGFEMPQNIEALFTDDSFYTPLSEENLDVLDDLDVLLVLAANEQQRQVIESSEMYTRLAPVREGRVVVLDTTDFEMAVSSGTIPAMEYVLDELVARTEQALPEGR